MIAHQLFSKRFLVAFAAAMLVVIATAFSFLFDVSTASADLPYGGESGSGGKDGASGGKGGCPGDGV